MSFAARASAAGLAFTTGLAFAAGLPSPPRWRWSRRAARAAELPIFDAHIHYSHDAVDLLPPTDAIAILRKAGIRRALVSSSGDGGTQKLLALAPELILPSLRPYRSRGEIGSWVRDESVVAFLEERLAASRYVALGEFHVYGADADLPVVTKAVALARKHNLVLHAHSDADAVERLFRQYPDARILWAHSGFERPDGIAAMLKKHPKLWCDLAFRSEHGGDVPAEWRALFEAFPDRFMVGTDTFTPERWHYIGEHRRLVARVAREAAGAAGGEDRVEERRDAVPAARRGARREVTPRSTSTAALAAALLAALAPAGARAACGDALGAGVARVDGERYTVAWRADPAVPVGRHFALDVEVCPRAGAAMPATLAVDATMPAHRHGMNYTPTVTATGPAAGAPRACCSTCPAAGNWCSRRDRGAQRVAVDLDVR